jgi:hypothetical protein
LDQWEVRIWLCAPVGSDHRGEANRVRRVRKSGSWRAGKGAVTDHAGPMVGTVHLDADPNAPAFLFARPGRTSVRVLFEQVTMWQEIAPPPAPLPAEDVQRR